MYRSSFRLAFVLAALAVLAAVAPLRAETVIVPGENLHVIVDIDHCALAGSVVCGGTGSALVPAAAGNDSVVLMIVQVKAANGNAVGGLTESDFALSAIINPPPGVSLSIVDSTVCPACFSELPTGAYRMAVRPAAGNWGEGTYITHLEVSNASGASARTVIPINIAP